MRPHRTNGLIGGEQAMELPGVHDAADQASGTGQRTYLALSAIRLISLLVAALAGAIAIIASQGQWLGWIMLAAFFAAGVSEVLLITLQPERAWYAGRAIAESTKTLAWRYAVGGEPFPLTLDDDQAGSLLRMRISQVLDKGRDRLDLSSKPLVVTASMKGLRSSSFDVRREVYLASRTKDQREWYSSKARSNAKWATAGRYALLVGEFGAVVAAALALQADRLIDFAGIIAALVASGAAWLAIKQHSQLTSAYRVAAVELALQEETLAAIVPEKWAQAVADAEEAISREHTMWLASRGNERVPGATTRAEEDG
ncbi:DUF4231 domain-containing protein [Microbacterium sp. W4I4]|uniref:DUF4231 domain-containing protein n=1 Tax=Microbacterium sp. W4I4 TaxID=3042295 RepID=UPI0027D785E5|nr:DUF4231 domain-containing protein [Microbacterium sp. W4I4]